MADIVLDADSCAKRKKGIKHPSDYKPELLKRAKLKGLPHTTYKGDVFIPGRITGPPCTCKKMCFNVIGEENRQEMLRRYHDFQTKNEQDGFLQSLIEMHPIQRRRQRTEDSTRSNSASYKFHVLKGAQKIEVCKIAYISLFSVSVKRIRRLQNLILTGVSPKDGRGIGNTASAIPAEEVQRIMDHIRSFPIKESHYSGRDYKYLDARLTATKMHALYQEKYPESKTKYGFYLKTFKERFDLGFGRPQVDTCCKCEELSVKIKSSSLNDAAKRVAAAELIVHKRRSNKFYSTLKCLTMECKSRNNIAVICFDYMQNLPLPDIPVQEIFYYRQLWVNAFSIHNMKTDEATFYLYHEGIAKKGPDEVCSFILDYINSVIDKNVTELYVFSDGCAGQNKNHTVVRFFSTLVNNARFSKIVQYFPIRGHSFLPCDRDFGVVKRVVRRTDRIYVPMEYCEMIVNAGSKFIVKMVHTADIINFKTWWPQFFKKTCLSIESMGKHVPRQEKVTFAISSYMELEYKKSGTVVTRNFIGGADQNTFVLRAAGARSGESTNVIPLPIVKSYPDGKNPINSKKIGDIRKVLQYIPMEALHFYKEIIKWPMVDGDNNE